MAVSHTKYDIFKQFCRLLHLDIVVVRDLFVYLFVCLFLGV